MNHWHTGFQEEVRPGVFETHVSCSGGRPATCDPHAQGGAQCGEQRRSDLKHINTKNECWNKTHVDGCYGIVFDAERLLLG